MKRTWILLAAVVGVAVAVGFQQAEPLDELRKLGRISTAGWHVDDRLHGLRFVPDESREKIMAALAILPRCPSVNRLVVRKMPNLHDALAEVAAVSHIVALDMRHTDPGEKDLAALAGMKNLQFLDLSRNETVTDASVAALAGLENLRYLDLAQTKVTGTGLKDRADMVNLEHLTLNECPVTDDSLAAIPRFPKLTNLFLGGTKVTDEGLMSLVGWHSLRRVVWNDVMTLPGQRAFNQAFNEARRKARAAGEWTDDYDRGPIFMTDP